MWFTLDGMTTYSSPQWVNQGNKVTGEASWGQSKTVILDNDIYSGKGGKFEYGRSAISDYKT